MSMIEGRAIQLKSDAGYTISARAGGRVELIGGTHDGAYAPVTLAPEQLEAFIDDLRAVTDAVFGCANNAKVSDGG